MATIIARYRNITLTQGGADAFVQAQEITGIDPTSGRAWMLRRAELVFPQDNTLQNVSADFSIHWSITRDSKTASPGLDDPDCLMLDGVYGSLTTSGQIVLPARHVYEFTEGVLVVEPEIYFQLDSAATGLTLTPDLRLYYDEVKLTEVEILRMLTQG